MAIIPGPWKVYQPEPAPRPAYRIRNSAGLLVATVPIMAHPGAEESANLIAAAPDLLASLQLAHTFLDSLPKGWLGKTTGDIAALNDFYITSRAAIAKAEGRS